MPGLSRSTYKRLTPKKVVQPTMKKGGSHGKKRKMKGYSSKKMSGY